MAHRAHTGTRLQSEPPCSVIMFRHVGATATPTQCIANRLLSACDNDGPRCELEDPVGRKAQRATAGMVGARYYSRDSMH